MRNWAGVLSEAGGEVQVLEMSAPRRTGVREEQFIDRVPPHQPRAPRALPALSARVIRAVGPAPATFFVAGRGHQPEAARRSAQGRWQGRGWREWEEARWRRGAEAGRETR